MPGPPSISPSVPVSAQSHARSAAAAVSPLRDPLAEPINRGPAPGATGSFGGDSNPRGRASLERNAAPPTISSAEPDRQAPHSSVALPEIDPAAQPLGEDGVMEDMGTLAIDNSRFGNTDFGVSHLEEITRDEQAELHLTGDFTGMEDSAIMLELKAGNMAGFDYLLQKYRRPIVSFMYRMTRNQAVAEELAQEVFLRVYRSRATYRAEARFSTWLYRIATNLGVNHARDTRHERSASTVYLDEADADTGTTPDVADATPGVEARLLRDERMAAIREHVMALPERQRMGVLMHKYEGMDYKQIGEVLKLSESATKSLLFRAYQTLREKLKAFV